MGNFLNMDYSNKTNSFITLQNCREDIIGELDAINQYSKHIYETDNQIAKKTLEDIMLEEQVHVGQLFGLLFSLDPRSKTQFEKGYQEFMNNKKRM